MFPERLLCQISRSNINEALPPTMQPVFVWVPAQKTWPQHLAKEVVSPKKNRFHWVDWYKNLSGGDDFPHSFNRFDFLSCGKEKYVNLSRSGYKFMLLPATVKPSCIYFSNCTVPQMRLLSWHGHEQPMGDGTFFYVWKSRVKIEMCKNWYGICHLCLCSYVSRVFSGRGQLRDFCQRHLSSQPRWRPLHLTVLLCWLVFRTQDQPPKIHRWLLRIHF